MGIKFLDSEKHSAIIAVLNRAPYSAMCFLNVSDFVCFAMDDYQECENYENEFDTLSKKQQRLVMDALIKALALDKMAV